MRSRAPALLIGLFSVGVILIGLGFYSGFNFSSEKNNELEIRIVPIDDLVTVTDSSGKNRDVKNDLKVFGTQSITTDNRGQAKLLLPDNSELILNPNTRLTIDMSSRSLSLKRGDLTDLRIVTEKKWTLTQGSKKFWLEDYSVGKQREELDTDTSDSEKQNINQSKSMVLAAVQRQRSSFFKCYSQKLIRDPKTLKVQALVGVTIQPSGKISKTKVISITPQDELFENCLMQVMERIQIPSFQGLPVETAVPFEFE